MATQERHPFARQPVRRRHAVHAAFTCLSHIGARPLLYSHAMTAHTPTHHTHEGATILVVEDDPVMADIIRGALEHAGYRVETVETGEEGIASAQQHTPSLVLLDLMLPLRSGWETCRALRVRADMPIIMVTARRAEEDRLHGFAEGADDYITKPFSPRELVARVSAVLRRTVPSAGQPIAIGDLTIDPRRHEVRVAGAVVPLRLREYELLTYLAANAETACTRADLLDHVWGYDFAGDERTLDTHIRRLRDALGPAGHLIHTVWGVGYMLTARPAS